MSRFPSIAVPLALLPLACGGSDATHASGRLSGTVLIDGSSTVFPITEAVAEEFRGVEPHVQVPVGISGTGGGFKKLIAGEKDIADASRFIKPTELEACAAAGREFIELPVAFDGLAVVVNPANTFARTLTVAELRAMWAADSTSKTWRDIRPEWPEREFRLYAPGQDSGTFDYFTEVVNGKSGNCRADATFSEDDNVLVRGVAGDPDGIAFFGFAYYVENQSELAVVAIDGGKGPVKPTHQTVEDGTYAPLSRPLFIYVSRAAAERPEVDAFVRFYLEQCGALADEVGYVALPPALQEAVRRRYERRALGTVSGRQGTLAKLYL